MLKNIAPLGLPGKDRKNSSARKKTAASKDGAEEHGSGNMEILELSPLARFVAGFKNVTVSHDANDETARFTVNIEDERCLIRFEVLLELSSHLWEIYWDTHVFKSYTRGENELVEIVEEIIGEAEKENIKEEFNREGNEVTLTLKGKSGKEFFLRHGENALSRIRDLLELFVVPANIRPGSGRGYKNTYLPPYKQESLFHWAQWKGITIRFSGD